eukprot:14596673-Alexandrium_andersonii.AAC.1
MGAAVRFQRGRRAFQAPMHRLVTAPARGGRGAVAAAAVATTRRLEDMEFRPVVSAAAAGRADG